MIRDRIFKASCIPLLGITIPLAAQLIQYRQMSFWLIVLSNLFFISTSFFVWQGAVAIISRARGTRVSRNNIFIKLLLICTLTATYGFLLTSLSALLWQKLVQGKITLEPVWNCGLLSAGMVIFLTLVYETIFLSREREIDIKVVDQLDKERLQAEIMALKGELDPHFLFNSLTILTHLISTDAAKAKEFTQKLALVYKYLLVNKDHDLISLQEELQFINDYFFLLRIRYENKVNLQLHIKKEGENIMVLPCSLQLLIENAIKHNYFTEADPLTIVITENSEYLKVENNIRNHTDTVQSTKVGLGNLNAQYKLLCNRNIQVSTTENKFIVKLPLIKQPGI